MSIRYDRAVRHRLLLVFNTAEFVFLHRAAVVRGLRDAGFDVHLVAPPGGRFDELGSLGVTVHEWKLDRKGTGALTEAATIERLVRVYRAVQPRVGYHETIKPVIYGSLAARAVGVPRWINAISGLGSAFLSSGLRARLLRRIVTTGYRLALASPRAEVLLQNEDDERDLRALGALPVAKRVSRFGGAGVDLERFPAAEEPESERPLVVLPGRMLADKGVVEFVEASRLLRNSGLSVRMALVGGVDLGNPSGIPEETLKGWVREGVVEWWGQRGDMPEVLRLANVVCLPSYREGIPKVLMEAGAVGRAIVTTDVPGCRDVVERGRFGLLVPPRDARALADALSRMLTDRALRARLAKEFQRYARDRYDERLIVQQYSQLFERLASS